MYFEGEFLEEKIMNLQKNRETFRISLNKPLHLQISQPFDAFS
jgi:hypothetical protein